MHGLIGDLSSLVESLKELATAAANANSAAGGLAADPGGGLITGRPTGYSSPGTASLRDIEGGGAGGGGAPGVVAKLLGLAQVLGRAAGLIPPGQGGMGPGRPQLVGSSSSLGYMHSQSMQGRGEGVIAVGLVPEVGGGGVVGGVGGEGAPQKLGGSAAGGAESGVGGLVGTGRGVVGAGAGSGPRASRIAGTASLPHVGGLSTNRGIKEAYPRLI
jgi:hypothetical protein